MEIIKLLEEALPAGRVVVTDQIRREHAHDYWALEAIRDLGGRPAPAPRLESDGEDEEPRDYDAKKLVRAEKLSEKSKLKGKRKKEQEKLARAEREETERREAGLRRGVLGGAGRETGRWPLGRWALAADHGHSLVKSSSIMRPAT